ncbi:MULTISPECIES: multidrug effflux MFS transporter [Pseudovibrio]|uniref:multidrug effflux MFS transporter n=1 Tax=Stappiaceae TaxID=2821832 RepID=UPI0023667DA2|nr:MULTISPECIES: multidrug effflux MFS transporter [Pseudovibrio]MDD7910210.1 multidrug effflux MFS transporter [Pseudovibrio exalbescens]MDX5593923.1 multidrug effflux MFS transporter [Pseudovibrio sp. SPO723]
MSSMTAKGQPAEPHAGLSLVEVVLLIAALMALNALSIDIMLPALPQMGSDLGVVHDNDRQLILSAYLLGLGGASLIFGPVSDWLGRRPTMLAGIVLFVIGTIFAIFATTFEAMLLARLVQGIGAAAPRVVTISMVRDWYHGRQMGRVMSLAMMVFMAAPIIAPSLGQAILFLGPWRWIFIFLTLFAFALMAWCITRLPESLPPEKRLPLNPRTVARSYWFVLTNRYSLGYMLAVSCTFGALFGFINSAQQVLGEVYGLGASFTLVFAGIAAGQSVASFLNAQFVEKYGLRMLSHCALVLFVIVSAIASVLAFTENMNLWGYVVFQALGIFLFGFIGPNFNSMAMEPLGAMAGAGSAMVGFVTTTIGALLGASIGALFNGSVVPLTLGYFVVGSIAVGIVLWTEGGRLFKPMHEDQ